MKNKLMQLLSFNKALTDSSQFCRLYNGKSIAKFPKNYLLIGLITTGDDPKVDYILEAYYTVYENNLPRFNSDHVALYPDELSPEIYENAGITKKHQKAHGFPIRKVMEYIEINMGQNVLTGPTINRDVKFLFEYYRRELNKDFNNDYVDFIGLTKKVLPKLKVRSFEDVAKYYRLKLHNVSGLKKDCSTFWYCCERLKETAKNNGLLKKLSL